MAREVASTRIPGNESQRPSAESPLPEPPIRKTAANTRGNLIRPLFLVPHRLTAAERHQRICELAYRRAEQRGFASGNEIEDWLEAEREVDAGRY